MDDIKNIAERNEENLAARTKQESQVEADELSAKARLEISQFWELFLEINTSKGKFEDSWRLTIKDGHQGNLGNGLRALGRNVSDIECVLIIHNPPFPSTLAYNKHPLWDDVTEKLLREHGLEIVPYIMGRFDQFDDDECLAFVKFKKGTKRNLKNLESKTTKEKSSHIGFYIFLSVSAIIAYFLFK